MRSSGWDTHTNLDCQPTVHPAPQDPAVVYAVCGLSLAECDAMRNCIYSCVCAYISEARSCEDKVRRSHLQAKKRTPLEPDHAGIGISGI